MTIKDVAKLAGVSVATVSRVLNDDAGVTDELRQRVQQVITEVGYVPNNVGRNLRKLKSDMILVMLPTLSNPFYAKILEGIETSAGEQGYGVLNIVTHNQKAIEKKYLKLLATKQVDGVISFCSTLSAGEIREIAAKYPFVQCCEYTSDANVPYAAVDNYGAAHSACRYFLSQGHTKIAHISGALYYSSEFHRKKGYLEALAEAGIAHRDEYLVVSDYRTTSGYDLCRQLMELEEPPTAILTVSDMLSLGVVRYLVTHGYNVGEDVEVIGFDNASITKVYMPTLSTISQPRYELGQVSVELLTEKINNPKAITKGIRLPYELILRETTRRHLQK